MVSYSVVIKSANSVGSEPSAPTGTGLVAVCRTGSPTMRMGTTAMTGKLKLLRLRRAPMAGNLT